MIVSPQITSESCFPNVSDKLTSANLSTQCQLFHPHIVAVDMAVTHKHILYHIYIFATNDD